MPANHERFPPRFMQQTTSGRRVWQALIVAGLSIVVSRQQPGVFRQVIRV